MQMKLFLKIFSFTVIIVLIISSCRRDNFITDSNAKLEFSKDTVYFDGYTHGWKFLKNPKIYALTDDSDRYKIISENYPCIFA